MIDQVTLRAHHVTNGHDWKIQAIWPTRLRIDRAWSRRTATPANHIGADHKVLVSIKRFARTDAVIPPARTFVVGRIITGRVRITGQRMADEDRIAAIL